MRWLYVVGLLGCMVMGGCGGGLGPEKPDDGGGAGISVMPQACGPSVLLELRGGKNELAGTVEVMNDSVQVWVLFVPGRERVLKGTRIEYRRLEASSWQVAGKMQAFGGGTSYGTALPLGEVGACVELRVSLEVAAQGGGDDTLHLVLTDDKRYCVVNCEAQRTSCVSEELVNFRGYTGDEWLEKEGVMRGMLEEKFGTVFMKGMPVGCVSGTWLQNVGALEKWISQMKLVEEKGLAREIAVLSLNIAFDTVMVDFAPVDGRLMDLEVAEGDFEGWPLGALLDEANMVIGDCPSSYAPSQLFEVLSQINSNFSPAGSSQGYLRCATGRY